MKQLLACLFLILAFSPQHCSDREETGSDNDNAFVEACLMFMTHIALESKEFIGVYGHSVNALLEQSKSSTAQQIKNFYIQPQCISLNTYNQLPLKTLLTKPPLITQTPLGEYASKEHDQWQLIHFAASLPWFSDYYASPPEMRTPDAFIKREEIFASILNSLINASSDINAVTSITKKTALHLAAEHNHAITVAKLLDHNARRRVLDKDNNTALHLAARQNCKEVLAAFITHAQEKNEIFLLHEAPSTYCWDVPFNECLHQQNSTEHTPVMLAILNNHEDAALLLATFMHDFFAADENGNTALHLAAIKNYPTVIKTILGKNADVSVRNKNNQTALELARQRGHDEITKIFQDCSLSKIDSCAPNSSDSDA